MKLTAAILALMIIGLFEGFDLPEYVLSGKGKSSVISDDTSSSVPGEKETNVRKQILNSKFVHAGMNNGKCSLCHLPHSKGTPWTLNAPFPDGFYVAAKRDSFDLCFGCHETDLLEAAITTTATGFRNGDRNLHFVHMSGDKSRNCTVCHAIHGSDNEHLINTKVPFGEWTMPLNYYPAENGGSCSPGCHDIQIYTR